MTYAAIVAVVLVLLLLWWIWKKPAEHYNMNFHQSILAKRMDSEKDAQGWTLDDYILANHALTGQAISSPFSSSP